LGIVAGIFSTFSAAAQVSLVVDGEARGVVVTADAPTATAQYAAEELVRHVALATGPTLPVVPESEAPTGGISRVFVGMTAAAAHVGIDAERLPREAYALRTVGNDFYIVGKESDGDPLDQGNPDAGTLFGVYELLERYLGVRWLWPGELGTFVPKSDSLEFSAANETDTPRLVSRSFYWGRMQGIASGQELSPEDARLGFSPEGARNYALAVRVLLRRHRMGGIDAKVRTGHAFSGWWEKHGEEHPEWFALRNDGTRGHPEKDYPNVPMCVSNESLQDFVVEQWDGGPFLLLGPVDRPGRCVCENCRAWDGPQPDPIPWFAERIYKTDYRSQELMAGSTSDRYARFWKAVQAKAAKRNPDVLVSVSFIYENEFPVPTEVTYLGPNMYGEFVQWQDPHQRYFPMPEEAYDWIKEQWVGWRKTGIRMGYRPNYLHDGYVMPQFETRQSGEFFKFAYERGMENASFDSLTGQWAVQGLRLYMHLRLMSKPDLSLEAIRGEYLAAFGPAADVMDRYFQYWEDYSTESVMRHIKLYWDVGWRYRVYVKKAHEAFPPECFEPAESMLSDALEVTEGHPPEFAERVQFVQIGLQHAQLAVALAAAYDGNDAIPDERRALAETALSDLVAFRKANEHTFFSNLVHAVGFWERPHIDVDTVKLSTE
jgi:hypothetical protein